MGYTYDELEAYRHGSSFLICFAAILMFFGGYFSAQLDWNWAQISALLAAWLTFQYLGSAETKVKMDFYTMIIRVVVSILVGLLFWLIFQFGYAMGPGQHWPAFLPLVFVYFISAKYIHKPYKRGLPTRPLI